VVVTSVAHGLTRQGQSITMPMAQVYTLRHGKISHVRPFYFDTTRLLF
jgi:ketosteroid isomerase-like protein